MPSNDNDPFQTLMNKLARLAPLDAEDRQAISALPFETMTVGSGHYLVWAGDTPEHCSLLLQGYACREKETDAGSRQIVSFHMAGDLLDVQHMLLERADHNVVTISDVRVARLPRAAVIRLVETRPAIAKALWRDTLIEASIFREWVLNIGRRDAKSRIAHMLCEFACRRQSAGLGDPQGFEFPMTQHEIADATGLTSVHVNRTVQLLKQDGALAGDRGKITIRDFDRLQRIAGFDPLYLHAAA